MTQQRNIALAHHRYVTGRYEIEDLERALWAILALGANLRIEPGEVIPYDPVTDAPGSVISVAKEVWGGADGPYAPKEYWVETSQEAQHRQLEEFYMERQRTVRFAPDLHNPADRMRYIDDRLSTCSVAW